MIVGKATNVGEYSVSRIDIRADDLLISTDEHARTSVSEHGDRHSLGPPGAQTAREQHAGLPELDTQPFAARIRPP